MPDKNNHPSMDEIMEFVSLSGNSINKDRFGEYFDMVAHFMECSDCRKMKEKMIGFSEKMDSLFDPDDKNCSLKTKIEYSLDYLNVADEWRNKEILMSVRGKGSASCGESSEKKASLDCMTDEDTLACMCDNDMCNRVGHSDSNRICLDKNKLEVELADDGKDNHSVLIIPDNAINPPVMYHMKKNNNLWQISLDCPEDDCHIVVF